MCLENYFLPSLSLHFFVKVVLKILGHAPILILVIHFLLGWVAAVYEFTKGLDARVQAKTYDLWGQLLTLMKCLLFQSICLFILFFCMRGEFHLAHLSTLKGLAASCSEWEIHVNSLNSEFQLHWNLSFSSFFSKTLSNIVSSSFNCQCFNVWMI